MRVRSATQELAPLDREYAASLCAIRTTVPDVRAFVVETITMTDPGGCMVR